MKERVLRHVFKNAMKLRDSWVPSNYGVFLGRRLCEEKGISIGIVKLDGSLATQVGLPNPTSLLTLK